MIRDRASGELREETVFGDRALRFFYQTLLGRGFWGLLFNSSCLSRLLGLYYDSPLSRRAISSLASTPGCHGEEAEKAPEAYSTFNDFFTRRLKEGARPFDASQNILSSPADGRLLVYASLGKDDPIPVKGAKRTLNELCCGLLPGEGPFAVGVIRLAPVDYHRYHFPCDCVQESPSRIVPGKYHSVNPVALAERPDIYVENARHITLLSSPVFGEFLFLEVGAFGVGSIVSISGPGAHAKMEEKGYFKFGGSTVILIFDGKKIVWDGDLLKNTGESVETLVRCGSTLAAGK